MIKKANKPYTVFRIPSEIRTQMLDDLRRPHAHACERVGFLFIKSKTLADGTILVIAVGYQSVADEDYIEDSSVGAKIGSTAIRGAMQEMLNLRCGAMHVHLHDHKGRPYPSGTDTTSLPGVIESLSNVAAGQVTGVLILSKDSFYSALQVPNYKGLRAANLITVVGFPMELHYQNAGKKAADKMFDRQSFLGENSQFLFENVRIGIIGYGGGGSHIGQQLAHVGIMHPYVFDEDHIEESNLNRLVGGKWKDVLKKLAKTTIAKRLIKSVLLSAVVTVIDSRWQDAPEKLQQCDIVVGGIDSYSERQQLESECRRYLIPYVDIGMDVYKTEESTAISGQVMLSLPGMPCFWCYGFLTEEKLGKEAAKYGKVGGRPQVVWPNGVLASTAVGLVVELVTGWTGRSNEKVYLEYDGNTGTMQNHVRLRFCTDHCDHYTVADAGPVRYTTL